MTPHEWIVLAVMALAIGLFITERLSIDLVALVIILLLVVTGVLSPKEGLAGFGDLGVGGFVLADPMECGGHDLANLRPR